MSTGRIADEYLFLIANFTKYRHHHHGPTFCFNMCVVQYFLCTWCRDLTDTIHKCPRKKKLRNLPKVVYRLLVFVYLMFEGSIANSKCLSDWKWSKQSLSFPHWMKATWNKAKNGTKSTKYKSTRKGKCKTQQEHITNIFCPQEIDHPFVFSILCVSNMFVVVVLMCFRVFFLLTLCPARSFSPFFIIYFTCSFFAFVSIVAYIWLQPKLWACICVSIQM